MFLQKLILNLKLDYNWLRRAPRPLRERLRYTLTKYLSIFGNRRSVNFLGKMFSFDNQLTPALLTDYVFELEELNKFVRLHSIHSMFDIGANIGQFSFTFKSINPNTRIYSFEPNPAAFKILSQNAKYYADWTCSPFGVGQNNAHRAFYFVEGKSAQGSVYKLNATQGLRSTDCRQIQVDLKNLDQKTLTEFSLPSHVDLIKIDVEGAEQDVLEALASVKWKYLYMELSETREGALGLQKALAILSTQQDQPIKIEMKTESVGTYQVLLSQLSS